MLAHATVFVHPSFTPSWLSPLISPLSDLTLGNGSLPFAATLRASGPRARTYAVATDESTGGERVGVYMSLNESHAQSGYSNTDLSDRLPTLTGPLAGRFSCLSQLREVVFPSDSSAVHCYCTAGMQRFAHVSLTTHTYTHTHTHIRVKFILCRLTHSGRAATLCVRSRFTHYTPLAQAYARVSFGGRVPGFDSGI